MNIYIASDHAGFELKEHLLKYLQSNGYQAFDKGPFEFNPGDDYPDFVGAAAHEVSLNPQSNLGIVIGMSGQGEAIVANKFKGIRAGVYYGGNEEIPKLMREHNNANILSLGAKFLTKKQAEDAVMIWLDTEFSNDERHTRRIKKIHDIESK
jgi:ribose 5-phosphate isomerase B